MNILKSSPSTASSSIVTPLAIKKPALNEVFIVHGHDEEAKTKTARFIEKLGFKPIILHEQTSSGKTIIEKIEEYSNVGFGIVLYTPCDIGGKKKCRNTKRHIGGSLYLDGRGRSVAYCSCKRDEKLGI